MGCIPTSAASRSWSTASRPPSSECSPARRGAAAAEPGRARRQRGGGMIRLFVGIALPPELRLRLSLLCSGVPGARWVDPGNFHVTLRFIGEVDEGTASDIDVALAQIVAPRFALTLAG